MSETQWNIKPRLVRCPQCKKEKTTDEAGPRCDDCGCGMITVIN